MKAILISAGETSGDIHGANLVRNLRMLNAGLSFFGIGGKEMQKAGVDLVERMDEFSIVGVWEALVKLKSIHRLYKKIAGKITETKPDIAILIDYPGFNLTLARNLKKMGVKVIYYITPQVWAWGGFRIGLIKKYVDKAIVILKFEEELFKRFGIDASFVGHPILDMEEAGSGIDKKSLGLNPEKFTIALLPGSRISEVKKILPLMLKTSLLISKEKDVQFLLLKTSSVEDNIYNEILKESDLGVAVVKDNTFGCLSISDFVFACSGTATLESAIAEKPMLITYKTSFLTFLLFKIFVKTRWIGLVNIIARREIAPEITQYAATAKRLAKAILSIISSKERMEEELRGLREVKHALGKPGASFRAAQIIEGFVTQQR